jgi:hypothetical protein
MNGIRIKTKNTVIQDIIIITGVFILLIGVWHPILPPLMYTHYQQYQPSSLSILQEIPTEVLLDIPGQYQDLDYLYLNPLGICRFDVRGIIIDYWHQLGYIPYPTPNQGQLVWEETNASVPKELVWQKPDENGIIHNHEWSFQERGLYVEHGLYYEGWTHSWMYYWSHWISFSDTTTELNVMKYYLSKRVPFYFSLYINSTDLWSATENGKETFANHAVVFYGYNSTGFFFWNTRAETSPYSGPNKFITNDILIQGLTHSYHTWGYQVAIPPSYELQNICVTITVKIEYPDGTPIKNYPVSTNFNDAVYTDQNGVVSLKVSPFFDNIYIGYLHSQLSSTYEVGYDGLGQLEYQLGIVNEGDNINIKFPTFDSTKAFINSTSYIKPLYTPPPEIPKQYSTPVNVTPPPLPPIETGTPIYTAQVAHNYQFPSELIVGPIFIFVGIISKIKIPKIRRLR